MNSVSSLSLLVGIFVYFANGKICFEMTLNFLTYLQSIFWLSGASGGYTQDWLKGDETIDGAHPHEGLRLSGGDGWVAVGGTLSETTRKVIYMPNFLSFGRCSFVFLKKSDL